MSEIVQVPGDWSSIHGSTCECGGTIHVFRDFQTLQVTDAVCSGCSEAYEPQDDTDDLAKILARVIKPNSEGQEELEEDDSIGYTYNCIGCHDECKMEVGEVEYYREKGFQMPKRCPECLQRKKERNSATRKRPPVARSR